jgi:hypothetical protein
MISMSPFDSPGTVGRLPVPLDDAAGAGEAAGLLGEQVGRQAEHLGRILVGSTSLNSPCVLPELGRVGGQRIDDDQELQLGQRIATFFLFATEASGLKPWQKKPFILPWCMRSKIASTS